MYKGEDTMRRILSAILTLAMLLSVLLFAASAAKLIGDVNEDGAVNAKDVTILRRYIAGGYNVTIDERVGNTNGDSTVNLQDVTILRRYLAGGYGIELGTLISEARQVSYTDAVTGGKVYADLGGPQFGTGAGEYSLTVLVDGKKDETYSELFKTKIVSGNTEEITPVGSSTEVTCDPKTLTVTLSTTRYYIAKIDGVYPAEGEKAAYITLKKADWNALPADQPFVVAKSGKTWSFTQSYTTDAFTAQDVGNYVVYTKEGESIKTLTPAETRSGAAGTFTGTADGILTSYDLDGTAYKVATREPAFGVDRAAAETVYPDLSGTNPTICLDPNGNLLHVVLSRYDEENSSAMFLAAARADKKKGDPRTMPRELKDGIKLLIIGNSFGNDCSLTYLPSILKDAGVKDYVIGTLYYSGCPYFKHVNFGMTDQAVYDFYENTKLTKPDYIDEEGEVAQPEKVTFDYALGHREWTHIMVLSSYSQFDKDLGDNPPWQDLLLCRVRNRCPDAYLGFDMTWSYKADYTGSEMFNTQFNNDQMALYRYLTEVVRTRILPEQRFKFVTPVGTAIQNARTSFIGDHMDRDGHHLNKGIGRYTAQMTVFCTLTGVSPDQITYLPNALVSKKTEYAISGLNMATPDLLKMLGKVARESVKNALENPYEVTQSEYINDNILWREENEMPID